MPTPVLPPVAKPFPRRPIAMYRVVINAQHSCRTSERCRWVRSQSDTAGVGIVADGISADQVVMRRAGIVGEQNASRISFHYVVRTIDWSAPSKWMPLPQSIAHWFQRTASRDRCLPSAPYCC